MLRRFGIRAWIDYECSTSIAKFTPVTTIFFLLNKICDGGSSKEPFLKAATLSILIWAYPRETKTNNENFKNAAISPRLLTRDEHAHSFCRCDPTKQETKNPHRDNSFIAHARVHELKKETFWFRFRGAYDCDSFSVFFIHTGTKGSVRFRFRRQCELAL